MAQLLLNTVPNLGQVLKPVHGGIVCQPMGLRLTSHLKGVISLLILVPRDDAFNNDITTSVTSK